MRCWEGVVLRGGHMPSGSAQWACFVHVQKIKDIGLAAVRHGSFRSLTAELRKWAVEVPVPRPCHVAGELRGPLKHRFRNVCVRHCLPVLARGRFSCTRQTACAEARFEPVRIHLLPRTSRAEACRQARDSASQSILKAIARNRSSLDFRIPQRCDLRRPAADAHNPQLSSRVLGRICDSPSLCTRRSAVTCGTWIVLVPLFTRVCTDSRAFALYRSGEHTAVSYQRARRIADR
ncbi:MAG: hypothetical protein JWP60_3053 [Ramlibacter sp.]|nr:hypothetical protein [Ramlibacter sp.]